MQEAGKQVNKILYTAKEVAEMLSLDITTVYAYAKSGAILSFKMPHVRNSVATKRNKNAVRFTVESIKQFLHTIGVDGFDIKEVP